MVPLTIPSAIREECNKFVSNFMTRRMLRLHQGLSHDGNWKESNDKLKKVALKILDTMRNVWNNPAFRSEFVESLNEGTYVNNVVVSAIHASLFDNPFGECAFITTFERQSLDRKKIDKRMGRRPDIMFISKESNKLYELMYAECRRVENSHFGIVGVQVSGCKLRLNVLLIRDSVEVHRYYNLRESEIPIRYSNDPSILEEFINTLLILRNILIVNINMSLLRSTRPCRSSRNLEDSSTISSDYYLATHGKLLPELQCRITGVFVILIVLANVLLGACISVNTFIRVCLNKHPGLGKYDWKLLSPVIIISLISTSPSIERSGSDEFWCGSRDLQGTLILLTSTVVIITFCYGSILYKVKKIDRQTLNETVFSFTYNISFSRWAPSLSRFVYILFSPTTPSWLYILIGVTINSGGIANASMYHFQEAFKEEFNSFSLKGTVDGSGNENNLIELHEIPIATKVDFYNDDNNKL
nr:11805_t:CDS:2 [Entrophospora candida]